MKIIPVLDILNGLVVHAVRGERQYYKPIKSVLCRSADPLEVAKTFSNLGFREVYLADLDAIMGGERNYRLYGQIRDEAGLELMVDAGISDVRSALEVQSSGAGKVIVGSETLSSVNALTEILNALGPGHLVVSIDIKGGRLLSRSAELSGSDPLYFAKKLEKLGVKYAILLDLDRVGTGQGVNLDLLKALTSGAELKIIIGGGIRDTQELCVIRDLGTYGALIATALHTGKITIDDLKAKGLL